MVPGMAPSARAMVDRGIVPSAQKYSSGGRATLEYIEIIPSEVVSDNGTQFANSFIAEFLGTLETRDAKIQAYSKEET